MDDPTAPAIPPRLDPSGPRPGLGRLRAGRPVWRGPTPRAPGPAAPIPTRKENSRRVLASGTTFLTGDTAAISADSKSDCAAAIFFPARVVDRGWGRPALGVRGDTEAGPQPRRTRGEETAALPGGPFHQRATAAPAGIPSPDDDPRRNPTDKRKRPRAKVSGRRGAYSPSWRQRFLIGLWAAGTFQPRDLSCRDRAVGGVLLSTNTRAARTRGWTTIYGPAIPAGVRPWAFPGPGGHGSASCSAGKRGAGTRVIRCRWVPRKGSTQQNISNNLKQKSNKPTKQKKQNDQKKQQTK